MSCNNNDTNGPSSSFLYTCNGFHNSCKSFLIFKSQPPYNTIQSISNLTSSNPRVLAKINHVTNILTILPSGKEVIVPVICSCNKTHNKYYEAETNYTLISKVQTYFTVANDTFQGLSTCDSLKRYNPYGELDLLPGMKLRVPLRCACPSVSQIANGTKFLLTYPVDWGDNVSSLALRFKVSESSVLDANVITTPSLYPFTTILIPLKSQPDSSVTIIHDEHPPSSVIFSPSLVVNRKRRHQVVVFVTLSAFVVVVFVVLFCVFLLRKKSGTIVHVGSLGKSKKKACSEDIREEIASIEHVKKVYRFEEIKEATENFSEKNRIKGSVYKGVFKGDIDVILAVKRMSGDASKEVNMLKKINHFNLIKLHGYCKNDGFFYLVFEYMEKGSLKEWLGEKEDMSIEKQNWDKRIQIALDIANGLQYLHNFTEPCYVHKDINTSNILLNKEGRAKIGNFSLAMESKGENNDEIMMCTSHVVGTRGYMAPEYLEMGLVSPQMDVYAFGVVLLELITGKDCVIEQDGKEVMLSGVMMSLMAKENDAEARLNGLVDPSLSGKKGFGFEMAKLSVACLVQERARRPSMSEIVSSLLKIHASANPRLSAVAPTAYSYSPRMER